MRVLIENGIVVNADGQARQDLPTESRIVRRLGADISSQLPCEETDASGCYVFPGGVDVHTHFNVDVSITRSCDDFFTGIRATVCGGTATVTDHIGLDPNGCRLRHQLEVYHGYAVYKAAVDYSFHGVVRHINHATLDGIPMTVEEGLSSFRPYLTYQYRLNDDGVLQALRCLYESGVPTTIHLENDAAIASKRVEFITAGLTAPRYHASSRPLECEAEAIARMIDLTRIAGNAPLCIVHLSNGLDLDYLRLARASYQPVWVETYPQYLLLDERSYDTEGDVKFILSPSLRNVHEQDKLWYDTSDDAVDVMTTGHCTFSMIQRLQISKGDSSRCPNGLSGVENRVQLLFSSGVVTRRILLERFAELTNAMPAGPFGLWPQKGILAPGSDGNVVTTDPRQNQQIQYRHPHDNAGYSPWEGFTCQGVIARTLPRGGAIFCDGTFIGKVGRGRSLRYKPFVLPVF